MESLDELQSQLLLVNTAIAKVLAGEKITEFEIGSGSSSRRYKYEEVPLEVLQTEKTRLLNEISYFISDTPAFRASSRMQLIHRKI